MAWNDYKPKGAAKGNEPSSGGAVLQSTPKFAVVKDNIDPLRCGRLRVYVEGMSSLSPDDAGGWVTVQYMSPFYGQTLSTSSGDGWGSYTTNSHSYGFWGAQPDIGTTVVVLFINGDPNYGVWIGSVPEPANLQMVPAIGAPRSQIDIVPNEGEAARFGGAVRLPAVNVNSNNEGFMSSPEFLTAPRPLHSYAAGVLWQQGLLRDPLRGAVGSSAQREAPSRVTGISTPGRPIYSGGYTDGTIAEAVTREPDPASLKVVGRRGGHSLVMDDGDIIGRDQMVRIRTSLGHQILMSDDGQCLSIIHSNGKSWVELGKEGTIDIYSTNSVNIRTQGDLNLHADNNININAKKSFNVSAESVNIESSKDTGIRVGANYSTYTVGTYTTKVDGTMSMASSGEGSYYSATTMYINGKKRVNLNSGECGTVPQKIKTLPIITHTDTLFDTQKGWLAAPCNLPSIVSRAPAHMPWDPLGSGVAVKVECRADSVLPQEPQPAVVASTTAAQSATPLQPPVTSALTKTLSPTEAVSSAVGTAETAVAVVAQAAVAATGPATEEAALRGGVTTVDGTEVPVIGKTALTPQQLEVAGVIKPGSSVLIQASAQRGLPLEEAAPEILFMGASGAENVQALARDIKAQSVVLTKNMQNAQAGLQRAGVITGKESGAAIVGPVLAAATNGVQQTAQHIRNTSAETARAVSGSSPTPAAAIASSAKTVGTIANGIQTTTRAVTGSISQMMSLGSRVSSLTNNMGGGLSAITKTLSVVTTLGNTVRGIAGNITGAIKGITSVADVLKGPAAGAYAAIKNSLPNLKAGVPQNTKAITEQAAARAQGGEESVFDPTGSNEQLERNSAINRALTSSVQDALVNSLGTGSNIGGVTLGTGSLASIASGAASAATNSVSGAVGALKSAATAAANSIETVAGTTKKVGADASNLLSTGSGIASGLSYIPGAISSVSTSVGGITRSLSTLGVDTGDTAQSLRSLNTGMYQITSTVNAAKGAVSGITAGAQGLSKLLPSGLPQLGADPAINGASAIGGLASTTNQLGGLVDKVKSVGGKLQDLALKNLSPSEQSKINSAIASVNTGDTTVKLPVTATNTTDFDEETARSIQEITGKGVSPPQFTGNPATFGITDAVKALEKINTYNRYIVGTAAALSRKNTDVVGALRTAQRAIGTFPEGSPETKAMQRAVTQSLGDSIRIAQSANTIINSTKTVGGTVKKINR